MWTQFISDDQSTAMRLDAMRTSHPIQVPIKHAEEVEEVFDMISYCKGASVVRILHAVLGPENFKRGLQIYMERHQYGNTITTDLWKAWEEASDKPIAQIMNSWTTQMGFPLIEVQSRTANADGSTTLACTQRWFLADGSRNPSDDAVPFCVGLHAKIRITLANLCFAPLKTYCIKIYLQLLVKLKQ